MARAKTILNLLVRRYQGIWFPRFGDSLVEGIAGDCVVAEICSASSCERDVQQVVNWGAIIAPGAVVTGYGA